MAAVRTFPFPLLACPPSLYTGLFTLASHQNHLGSLKNNNAHAPDSPPKKDEVSISGADAQKLVQLKGSQVIRMSKREQGQVPVHRGEVIH